MKILVVSASGRRSGSTAALVDSVLSGARESCPGAEVESVNLFDLDYKGCRGCLGCRSKSAARCVAEDGLTQLLDSLLAADAWVLSTPIYMGGLAGQFKEFFDRTFGFSGPDGMQRVPAGKKAVLATTQGYADEGRYKDTLEYVLGSLTHLGVESRQIAMGGRLSWKPPAGLTEEEEKKARELGTWLAGA